MESQLDTRGAPRATRKPTPLLRLLTGSCLLAVALLVGGYACASDRQPASVTIEASREGRAQLQTQVDQFVDSAVVQPHGESLMRWDTKVCPLVAGLPRDKGEFMLARLSQAARNAGAPLAPEKCTANFIVIVSSQTDRILAELRNKRPGLFTSHNGPGSLQHFLATPRPVRVWYNWQNQGDPGASLAVIAALIAGAPSVGGTLGGSTSATLSDYSSNRLPNSRLSLAVTRSINTAVILVDVGRMQGVNVGQLSDYVAMVGLAEINLDHSIDSGPSVLRLFNQPSGAPVEGMTAWDQALLKSLYSTRAQSVTQVSEMETQMVNTIIAQH